MCLEAAPPTVLPSLGGCTLHILGFILMRLSTLEYGRVSQIVLPVLRIIGVHGCWIRITCFVSPLGNIVH